MMNETPDFRTVVCRRQLVNPSRNSHIYIHSYNERKHILVCDVVIAKGICILFIDFHITDF